ncbi:MAG: LptA/OstA family protein [Acidobacteriota bacterium]
MNWQKQARLGIAVFVIVFVAIVVVALRQRKATPVIEPPPKRNDPSAIVENTSSGHFEKWKDGKLVFGLKFGTQFTYEDGRNKFGGGIELTADRSGKPYKVTSREAEVVQTGEGLKTAHFIGAVKLTSEGLEVTAEDATYDDSQGLLTVPGAVAFSRGRMKGTGVGATYDRGREVLWLLDQAHITVAADAQGQGALEANSGAAGMARADHYIKLLRTGHINAEGRLIDADEILILLAPATPEAGAQENDRVQGLQLRGNSRIAGGGAANGPQAMSARDIDLAYAEDGRTLQHAQLMENGVLQLPGEGKSTGQRIAGKTIDIALAPDGATITNLTATENVQLDIPSDGDVPAKRIRSATLTASGAPGAGLQNATFGGNVDYRETRAARGAVAAVDRAARSLSLIVETKPGFGALQQADFHGNVHFTDGPQVAADATRAIYHVDRDEIDMAPSDDPGPPAPRVSDGRVTVEARTIEFVLSTRKLKADTKVRSSMLPQQKPAAAPPQKPAGAAAGRGQTAPAPSGRGAAPARSGRALPPAPVPPIPAAGSDQPTHLPSLLKPDQVVTVTSNRLEYDGAVGHAVYSGNSRLWQGDTTVRGDTIIVDDKTGNLEARLNVLTDMMLDEVDAETNVRKSTRTKGGSEYFLYDDAKRLATYTGKAHLLGAEGDVSADKLELYLKPDTNELDRAEGYGDNGKVIVKEGGRTATGARLTYTAATKSYLITGTPVEGVELAPNDCKQSFGAVATFQRAVGTLEMQGNGVIRTTQKTIACPAGTR